MESLSNTVINVFGDLPLCAFVILQVNPIDIHFYLIFSVILLVNPIESPFSESTFAYRPEWSTKELIWVENNPGTH